MAEIYRYSVSSIKTKIFWNGEIRDADGTVTALLYDVSGDITANPPIDPTVSIASLPATKLETDIGTYQVSIPQFYTSQNKKYKIIWSYAVGGINGSHTTYTDVVTPYCSFEEVVEDLQLGSDPSDPNYKTYHELQMAEKYARKTIENYCNQSFYLYDDIQIAYGSGSDLLPLPFKLNTLHELYGNDILLVDNIVYTANGLVPPTINDNGGFGAFGKDVRYKVQGKFGWEEVPDNVEQACIQLMGDYFSKDRMWTNKYLKSIQTFDWQFEYNSDAYRGTGNAYADQLLNPYVVNGMVVI